MLAFWCVKSFFIDPYFKKKEEEELEQQKMEHASKISEKRKEAIAYRALMRETYSRIVDRESQTAGLIIERALYGQHELVMQYGSSGQQVPDTVEAFDVTVAVQVMLNDNATLNFSNVSKSYLPGFFDCHFGQPKKLFIRYRYHNSIYQVVLDERENALLPNERKWIQFKNLFFK